MCVVMLLYCLCVLCCCVCCLRALRSLVLLCVAVCKDNNKVDRCRNNGVVNRAVNRVVDSLKGWLVGLWIKWCGVGNE